MLRQPHRIPARSAARRGLRAAGVWLLLLLVTAGCTTVGVDREAAVFSAPRDEVLAAPSDDPLERLLSGGLPAGVAEAPVPPVDAEVVAALVHAHVNAVRAAHGLRALRRSRPLERLAAAHSRDMADGAYFGHVDPYGEGTTERAGRMGVRLGSGAVFGAGENLFLTRRFWDYQVTAGDGGQPGYSINWKTAEQLAAQAVRAWMDSPSHRANLLCDVYTLHGVAVAVGADPTLFFTQNFAAARR